MSKMIIIGTGASAAIDPSRFPTMDNFFQGVMACAKSDKDKNLVTNFLSVLDYERIFVNRDIDCENIAAQWRLFIPPNLLTTHDNKVKSNLRDSYLKILKTRFSKKYMLENLEILLDRSLNAPVGSSFSSILYMLNWLLGYSDYEIKRKSQALYHRLFNKFIGDEDDCSIVSFNYDLIIDCALVDWLKTKGDVNDKDIKQLLTAQDNFLGKIDPSRIRDFSKPLPSLSEKNSFDNIGLRGTGTCNRIKLLKPHGSLSFLRKTEDQEEKETLLVLSEKNNFAACPPVIKGLIAWEDCPTAVQALIVPPTQNKIKSHPILFETERHFIEKLSSPNTKKVVVIGWSLPPTDKDHENMIRQCITNRTHQIDELVAIDLKQERRGKDPHFDRMESIFRPKIIKKCWEGFNEAAIESYF